MMNGDVGRSAEVGIDGSWRMNFSAVSRRGEYDISETIRDDNIGCGAQDRMRTAAWISFFDYPKLSALIADNEHRISRPGFSEWQIRS